MTTDARPAARAARWGAAAVALVCAAAIAVAYVAERDVDRAAQQWTVAPDAARQRLDRAADLAPLDTRPLIVRAVVEQRLGKLDASRISFRRALDRDRHDWFVLFEIGLTAGRQRDRRGAREALQRALKLNPRDGLIRLAIRRLDRGRPLSFDEVDRAARIRVQRRLGRSEFG